MKKKFLLITGGTLVILAALYYVARNFASPTRLVGIETVFYGYLIGYFSAWFYAWYYGFRRKKG